MVDSIPVALVTGGTRGIGRAIVEALLGEGWNVGFCGRSAPSVERALEELRPHFGDRVGGRVVDVREAAAVDAFVAWAVDGHGRLDCLVNNAGIGTFGRVDSLTPAQWRETIDVNLSGVFHGIRAAAPVMRRQGEGWILNIGSLAGKNPFAGGAAYNASKFGLIGLSEAAMLDLRHDGIRVAAILPGSVNTEFGRPKSPEQSAWMLRPDDVARTVLDLVRYPARVLPSLVELRPTKPPKKG
jgi:NAD(P)-dependent dehydrogenase (short-subunit alcohol dehydrogenase family)